MVNHSARPVEHPAILDPARASAHFGSRFEDQRIFIPIHAGPALTAPDDEWLGFAADRQVAVNREVAVRIFLARADLQTWIFVRHCVHAQFGRRKKREIAFAANQLPHSREVWPHISVRMPPVDTMAL